MPHISTEAYPFESGTTKFGSLVAERNYQWSLVREVQPGFDPSKTAFKAVNSHGLAGEVSVNLGDAHVE